ncbi:protein of unknown function [Ruminococcaceae bacterium BL-6]|nr:protein of unknown function [Ruminococcaceae bacterium BL-6]
MNDKRVAKLEYLLTFDMQTNHKIYRLFSYKRRIRYDLVESILETLEKLCIESSSSVIENLQNDLTQTCRECEGHLIESMIDTLFDQDFFSDFESRYKRLKETLFILRYWLGVIYSL